jgi:hypothetical protein
MIATETFKSSEWMYPNSLVTTVFEETTDGGDVADPTDRPVAELTDLKFVGRATAAAFEDAEFDAQALVDKTVSYRMLVEAGVNPGVAAKIRRWHSLQWSFESGDDLSRRSEQVRGLQDDERAWVASSYGNSTETSDDAGSNQSEEPRTDTDGEAAWVAAATGDEAAAADDTNVDPADQFAAEASWVKGASAGRKTETETATADGSGDPVAAEAAWRERSKSRPLTDLDGLDEEAADRLAEAGVRTVRSLATADPELLADVTGLPEDAVREWHTIATELSD